MKRQLLSVGAILVMIVSQQSFAGAISKSMEEVAAHNTQVQGFVKQILGKGEAITASSIEGALSKLTAEGQADFIQKLAAVAAAKGAERTNLATEYFTVNGQPARPQFVSDVSSNTLNASQVFSGDKRTWPKGKEQVTCDPKAIITSLHGRSDLEQLALQATGTPGNIVQAGDCDGSLPGAKLEEYEQGPKDVWLGMYGVDPIVAKSHPEYSLLERAEADAAIAKKSYREGTNPANTQVTREEMTREHDAVVGLADPNHCRMLDKRILN